MSTQSALLRDTSTLRYEEPGIEPATLRLTSQPARPPEPLPPLEEQGVNTAGVEGSIPTGTTHVNVYVKHYCKTLRINAPAPNPT